MTERLSPSLSLEQRHRHLAKRDFMAEVPGLGKDVEVSKILDDEATHVVDVWDEQQHAMIYSVEFAQGTNNYLIGVEKYIPEPGLAWSGCELYRKVSIEQY